MNSVLRFRDFLFSSEHFEQEETEATEKGPEWPPFPPFPPVQGFRFIRLLPKVALVYRMRSRRAHVAAKGTYFAGAAHLTALTMILRTFSSRKIGFVSWPGWK